MEILLNKNEGQSFWVLGDLYTFKVTGRDTNGNLTVIDQVIQPQGGPPPHIHQREDELFYITEGRFSFLCENQQREFETGSFVYIPKGTIHTFKNIDDKPGKLLVTITPSGLEEFFYKIGTPAERNSNPPPFDPSIMDKLLRLAKEHHMDIMIPGSKP
jgi:quercetin dioxygenase-like cupin family protein